jgi:hypothetical protein
MAYNVLKELLDKSVDQHADQEIDGVKVFINTISASMFYDTDAKSLCATENNVAVKKLSSETLNGVMTYQGDKIAKSNYNLMFDGKTLTTERISADYISGCGEGITNVKGETIIGKVSGDNIEVSEGLESHDSSLRVRSHEGIVATDDGVSVNLHPNSGLGFKSNKLSLDLHNCLNVCEKGQNVGDSDIMILYDVTRGEVRHSTFKNLYENYLNFKVPHAEGGKNSIQIRGASGFSGTENFTFDPSSRTLSVKGKTKSVNVEIDNKLEVNGDLDVNGAVFKSIKTVSDAEYKFSDTDHTVLFDASENKIIATLPLARDCNGRVLIIKKICDETLKYKITANHSLVIRSRGELIDFSNEITMKSNYSTRTLQSDGIKWWIINRSGS